jgi:hypothetical protein
MPGPSAPSAQTPYNAGLESSNIAQSLERSLPGPLNIFSNPMFDPNSPQAQGYISNYANQFYNQAVMPQVSQMQTGQLAQGMQNSSAGGAQLGQAQAQGAVQSQLQGINAYESLLGGMNQTSAGYFGGPGQLGLGALGASNNYQNQRYGTESQNYRSQLGMAGSAIGGLTGKGGSALGNAASAFGGMGGGGGGASPLTGAPLLNSGAGGFSPGNFILGEGS